MNDSSRISAKAEILQKLAAQGFLSPRALDRSLMIADIIPSERSWKIFINRMLLLIGVSLLLAGVIFFFASNWDEMGKFAKLGLVQFLLLGTIIAAMLKGLDSVTGKIALFAASVLVGSFLALYGQIYQTGADAFELFLGWAAFIACWVVIGRFSLIWLLLLGLIDTGLILYCSQVVYGRDAFMSAKMYEILFILNIAFLIGTERHSSSGDDWWTGRWMPRIITVSALTFLVIPILILIFSFSSIHLWENEHIYYICLPFIYTGCAVFIHWHYQTRRRDLFMIAAVLLSAIIIVTSFIGNQIGSHFNGYMLLSLIVIAQSATAAAWLRKIANAWRETE